MRLRFLLSAGIAAALSAAALQAADTIAYTVLPSTGQFGTVDLNTGVFTPIAVTANFASNGFGVSGGALYGIGGGYVFQINFSTGARTVAPNYALSNNLQGFGSTSAGLFIVDGYGNLSTVNPVTGSPTLIGPTGITSGLGNGVLSTSADSTTLFWNNASGSGGRLYRLNTSTGAATLVGATGNGAGSGSVQAMLFEGGVLWASLGYNTGPTIGTLNTSTAAETFVTNTSVGNISALAPYPLSAAPSTLISSVTTSNAGPAIAQNAFIVIKGSLLVPASTPASGVIWSSAPSFAAGLMPTQLNGVSVTVDNKPAFVYFYCSAATDPACSQDQLNILTPLDNTVGPVPVVVTNGASSSPPFTVSMQAVAPSFFLFGATEYIAATHANGAYLAPAALYPGYTTPAQPNEEIVLYATGFGLPSTPVVNGSASQSGSLAVNPVCTVGGNAAVIAFAGLSAPGLYQLNLVVPAGAGNGDNPVNCTFGGFSTPAGDLITVQRP